MILTEHRTKRNKTKMSKALLLIIFNLCLSIDLIAQTDESIGQHLIAFTDGRVIVADILDEDKAYYRFQLRDYKGVLKKSSIVAIVPYDELVDSSYGEQDGLVILKNKEWFKADILEFNKDNVSFNTGESILNVSTKEVFKVFPDVRDIQEASDSLVHRKSIQSLGDHADINIEIKKEPKKRWYHITSFSVLNRSAFTDSFELNNSFFEDGSSKTIRGLGVQHVTGYHLNDYVGIGLGIGFLNYQINGTNREEYLPSIIPYFLEFRANASKKEVSPYFSLAAGFAKSYISPGLRELYGEFIPPRILDPNGEDIKANQRLFFHPAIGMKFKIKEASFFIDVGAHLTHVDLDIRSINCLGAGGGCFIGRPTEYEVKVSRVAIKLGVML